MAHPSEQVIQAARRQLQVRGQGPAAAARYQQLAREFQAESEFDSFGLRQCILDMAERPGGLLPPTKPTLRGRLGAFIIRQQAKALWWILRAIRTPERALKAAEATLRYQERRQGALEERLTDLDRRVRKIEDQGRQP
jgi:hypothetical protein